MSTKKHDGSVDSLTAKGGTPAGLRTHVSLDADVEMVGLSVEMTPRMKAALEELKDLTGRAMGLHVRDALNNYLTSDDIKDERRRYLELRKQENQIGR